MKNQKNQMSYKLDAEARLWVCPAGGGWRLSTSEEADRFFLCYPEMAAQAFWIGHRVQTTDRVISLAA